MDVFLLLLCLGLLSSVRAKSHQCDWCYHRGQCGPSAWVSRPFGHCNGQRQSPVDIRTSGVTTDPNLTELTFTGYREKNIMRELANNGHTVQVTLRPGAGVSGGGLSGWYSAVQFHFHWGNSADFPGSEHLLDGQRFPMELHIVHVKKGKSLPAALADPEGIAVLGFFIEATEAGGTPEGWKTLTSLLKEVAGTGSTKTLALSLSLDELLRGVDHSKFFRYRGSLTTPDCNEAVVWTVFQEPVRVSRDLIDQFTTVLHLADVYRPVLPLNGRSIFSSPAVRLALGARDGSSPDQLLTGAEEELNVLSG
ncbi:carbonic anhydrase 4-like isoform X1 [Lepisosteus oculatus]|uniref:carbonic anhydrase 4-like isoform X1 n=1 Tax=Lepisosteus oculatus TaxID=7918 RepID=UPI0035F50711